jgi:alcohol dehydrogenase class IV
MLSGMALANAKLGAVHGLAGPIGGRFAAPHGAVCARLLPAVLQTNIAALRARAPEADSLKRFDEVGEILVGRKSAQADTAVASLAELCTDLGIPPLRRYGLSPEHFPGLIRAAQDSSSMKGNPIALTDDELAAILLSAM